MAQPERAVAVPGNPRRASCALEKEGERNRAFAAHREGLCGDGETELVDYEDHEGRKLWIVMNRPEDAIGDFGSAGELRR